MRKKRLRGFAIIHCIRINFTLSKAPMELSTRSLEQALSIRRQIDALERRLRALVRTAGEGSTATRARRIGKRRMSATARAKIAAAARARWARIKGGRSRKKRGGGITAAGRRRLSQLMKARWAARRKSKSKKSGTGHTGPKRSE